jgi:outer membrane protein OmpA-like peptidoglycan-associated protein
MFKKFVLLAVSAAYLSACTTTDPYTGQQKVSNTAGGAAIGAGLGALAGLAVGGSPVGRRNAALIGAGIGALAGGSIGNYMDQQEAELRAQLQATGVSVTRRGDHIILNMPSNITFATDQDAVKPEFYQTLNSVAIVLRKFDRTLIDVNGHTDSTGSLQHNQQLSERRAASVANYLGSQGIDQRRISTMGFGPSQPIASNATEAGRAQNRRVEIEIAPITQNG